MDSPGPCFLDTNVLLRLLTRDDEEKAARALDLLLRVDQHKERVITSPLVIFETIFTLQKSYGVSRFQIRVLLQPILGLRDLELIDKSVHHDALDLFASTNLSYADSYTAAYMRWRQLGHIYSWDADFDRIPKIERIEPRS